MIRQKLILMGASHSMLCRRLNIARICQLNEVSSSDACRSNGAGWKLESVCISGNTKTIHQEKSFTRLLKLVAKPIVGGIQQLPFQVTFTDTLAPCVLAALSGLDAAATNSSSLSGATTRRGVSRWSRFWACSLTFVSLQNVAR